MTNIAEVDLVLVDSNYDSAFYESDGPTDRRVWRLRLPRRPHFDDLPDKIQILVRREEAK